MNNRNDKPKKSTNDLVSMLEIEKGITFNSITPAEAADYLRDKNNYLRTASYRKNYDKHETGANKNKYIKLDFAYLVELSKIDMYLRHHLLQMCIDVEHALKVALIADIEANQNEDGYSIVDNFLAENRDIERSIAKKAESVFTGDLIGKYFSLCTVFDNDNNISTQIFSEDCPAWVLVEILAFKDFLKFLVFYSRTYPGRMDVKMNLLNTVRNLRNACAHNNCLLISLRPGSTQPTAIVSQRIARITEIAKEERKNKLSCRPLFEIVCLLMQYEEWVKEPMRKHRLEELRDFAHGRLVKNIAFFDENQTIKTAILFLQKLVDNFN